MGLPPPPFGGRQWGLLLVNFTLTVLGAAAPFLLRLYFLRGGRRRFKESGGQLAAGRTSVAPPRGESTGPTVLGLPLILKDNRPTAVAASAVLVPASNNFRALPPAPPSPPFL